jgi:hypothetical protein
MSELIIIGTITLIVVPLYFYIKSKFSS